jgi:hypothetical protein
LLLLPAEICRDEEATSRNPYINPKNGAYLLNLQLIGGGAVDDEGLAVRTPLDPGINVAHFFSSSLPLRQNKLVLQKLACSASVCPRQVLSVWYNICMGSYPQKEVL